MSGDTARLQKELEHWKSLAEQYKQNFEAVQEDFSDFQSNSKDLEAELEAQLVQQEKKVRELQANNQKLNMECESLKAKLEALQFESSDQVNRLEAQLNRVRAERDDMQRYIRELEQMNDDLERAKRAALVSLDDFEKRLNETIERNAFLENELDEKESLKEYVQRLKEETRDLRQELKVKERHEIIPTTPLRESPVQRISSIRSTDGSAQRLPSPAIANGNLALAGVQSPPTTPPRMSQSYTSEIADGAVGTPPTSLNGLHLTPNARISALNIVGDLLRKVGALESKLANCRRFSVDQQEQAHPVSTVATNGVLSSPRRFGFLPLWSVVVQFCGRRILNVRIVANIAMYSEVQAVVTFLSNFLFNKLPRRKVNLFAEQLANCLLQKFGPSWFPPDPQRKAHLRCIHVNVDNQMDPLISVAASCVGLELEEVTKYLPTELTMWVNPGEVSYRVGQCGTLMVLYSARDTSNVALNRLLSPASISRGGHTDVTSPGHLRLTVQQQQQLISAGITKFDALSLANDQGQACNMRRNGVTGATFDLAPGGPVKPPSVPASAANFEVASPNDLKFTVASFAMTRFGTTKLKSSPANANKGKSPKRRHHPSGRHKRE